MEPWILALVALIVAILVVLSIGRKRVRHTPNTQPTRTREPCPLCGSPLVAGERVHSERFSAGNEAIVHIRGCPRCHPPNDANPRICPVCKAVIPAAGYVIGRMWEKRPARAGRARHHLHVLGCTVCRRTAVGRA